MAQTPKVLLQQEVAGDTHTQARKGNRKIICKLQNQPILLSASSFATFLQWQLHLIIDLKFEITYRQYLQVIPGQVQFCSPCNKSLEIITTFGPAASWLPQYLPIP
jgi:hypothetical protein